ncbi:hypothetical protein [Leptospira sp. B5-022]|uniref:glycine zipper family protein n=1 Tax=Leptospira sp. B5-022 TaxID=1242992 RepID=UPI0002BE366A|nr:hypothetical protein [Leptospira sp. B5-022]EMJ98365.1 hypothetical protein LEP1GSC192_3133 [Leptospira sp. B5-022]
MKSKLRNLLLRFLPDTAQILGVGLGGYIGVATGEAMGAALGGVSGEVIGRVSKDLIERILSEKEKGRIEFIGYYSEIKIRKLLDSGSSVREDGFFENIDEISFADEIFEGVLIKAKNAYEEKKLPFIGNLFVNSVFSSISTDDIHQILNLSDQLSYNQLVLINIIQSKIAGFMKIAEMSEVKITDDKIGLYYNLIELQTKGVILDIHNEGDLAITGDRTVDFKGCALTRLGERIYKVLSLNEIPLEDIERTMRIIT